MKTFFLVQCLLLFTFSAHAMENNNAQLVTFNPDKKHEQHRIAIEAASCALLENNNLGAGTLEREKYDLKRKIHTATKHFAKKPRHNSDGSPFQDATAAENSFAAYLDPSFKKLPGPIANDARDHLTKLLDTYHATTAASLQKQYKKLDTTLNCLETEKQEKEAHKHARRFGVILAACWGLGTMLTFYKAYEDMLYDINNLNTTHTEYPLSNAPWINKCYLEKEE